MPRHVLFLCTGNYYRSRLAEELFNHRARALGLDWRATSRALAIERGAEENVGPISDYAVRALEKLSIPIRHPARSPAACTEQDFEQADMIIAMKEHEHRPLVEARFNAWAARVTYWHVHDLDLVTDFAVTGSLVDDLVDRLIDEIQRAGRNADPST
jgi:protein-tyrosine phosphatase